VERADIYSMLILAVSALVYAVIWLVPGRPYRPGGKVEPAPEPDEVGVAPAVCGYLMRGCRQADDDVTTTLLDLVDRGVVSVSPQPGDPDDQLLTLHTGLLRQVWPHEDALLRLLFEVAGEHEAVTLRRFDRFARERRREYERGLEEFRRAFGESTMGLQGEPLGRFTLPVIFVIPVVLVWVSAYTVAFADTYVYLLSAAALAALMLVHAGVMFRRINLTRTYQRRCARVRALLRDFIARGASLSGVHPLWGRYLVHATALGMEREMKDALQERRLVPSEIMGGEWPWWQTSVGEQDWRAFLLGGDGAPARARRWRR
jgi:hypothetical protein